jgi:lipoic acid synthetase
MSGMDEREGSRVREGATQGRKLRKPDWIRVRLPSGAVHAGLKDLMRRKSLHTVCEEALCPNMAECWGSGSATFLILGEYCTRNCGFCAVKSGRPVPEAREEEATAVADAVRAMGLRHVVVTSVTRDDLPDGGAGTFASVIAEIRASAPGCTVEVLIPDLKGDRDALAVVLAARPDVLGHNIETVERLYGAVRAGAVYRRSLELLSAVKALDPRMLTKSGLMLGLGETTEEVLAAMRDLRAASCDILTLGQYLCPSRQNLPVVRYATPEEFEALKEEGLSMGFRWVESGPLVRSSYHAERQVRELTGRGAEADTAAGPGGTTAGC